MTIHSRLVVHYMQLVDTFDRRPDKRQPPKSRNLRRRLSHVQERVWSGCSCDSTVSKRQRSIANPMETHLRNEEIPTWKYGFRLLRSKGSDGVTTLRYGVGNVPHWATYRGFGLICWQSHRVLVEVDVLWRVSYELAIEICRSWAKIH